MKQIQSPLHSFTGVITSGLVFLSLSLLFQSSIYLNTHFLPFHSSWLLTGLLYGLSLAIFMFRQPVNDEKIALVVPFSLLPFFTLFSLQIHGELICFFIVLINLFLFSTLCHSTLLDWTKNHGMRVSTFVGGALGAALAIGLAFFATSFNHYVYATVLVLCSFFRAENKSTFYRSPVNWGDFSLPLALGFILTTLRALEPLLAKHISLGGHLPTIALMAFAVFATIGCYKFHERPIRFALGLITIYAVGLAFHSHSNHVTDIDSSLLILAATVSIILALKNNVLTVDSSEFGKVFVVQHPDLNLHILKNNGTIHSAQYQDDRRLEPLSYYSRKGPVADIFTYLSAAKNKNIGVIGLGAGSLAAYGTIEQNFTFIDINPAVISIAQNPQYFSYLQDSASEIHCIAGDGRKVMESAPNGSFDLVIIDAFQGDDTPLDLLTLEAIQIYFNALNEHGALLIHISSDNYPLRAIIAHIAEKLSLVGATKKDTGEEEAPSVATSSHKGLIAFKRAENVSIRENVDSSITHIEKLLVRLGILKTSELATNQYEHIESDWLVLARYHDTLEPLIAKASWHVLHALNDLPLLTDESVRRAAILNELKSALQQLTPQTA